MASTVVGWRSEAYDLGAKGPCAQRVFEVGCKTTTVGCQCSLGTSKASPYLRI
jgi:hypothetical protein